MGQQPKSFLSFSQCDLGLAAIRYVATHAQDSNGLALFIPKDLPQAFDPMKALIRPALPASMASACCLRAGAECAASARREGIWWTGGIHGNLALPAFQGKARKLAADTPMWLAG